MKPLTDPHNIPAHTPPAMLLECWDCDQQGGYASEQAAVQAGWQDVREIRQLGERLTGWQTHRGTCGACDNERR